MRNLGLVVVCVLIACWLCGCGGGSSVTPGEDQVSLQQEKVITTAKYLPLKPGNIWRYRSSSEGTDTSRVTGKVMIANRAWFHERYVTGSGSIAEGQYRHINAGLFRRQGGVEWLIIKAPVRKNATWVATDDKGLTLNFRIHGFAKVTVLAGTYENCLVVDVTKVVEGLTHRARLWFAPGTGIVKSVDYVNEFPVHNVQLKSSSLL